MCKGSPIVGVKYVEYVKTQAKVIKMKCLIKLYVIIEFNLIINCIEPMHKTNNVKKCTGRDMLCVLTILKHIFLSKRKQILSIIISND